MNRRFFITSVGQKDKDYVEDNLKRCIKYSCHAMHQNTSQKGVFSDVSEHSICFLKFNDNLIAFGEVERISTENDSKLGDWNWIIKVKEWIFFDKKEKRNGVTNYGVSWNILGGAQMATIKEIKQEYALEKMHEIDSNADLYKVVINEINTQMHMNNLVDFLKNNKNLILTGAPGTGKTYLAKQIAKQIIGVQTDEELEESGQFNFVQFHPSYDYTDFVEGLRPTPPDENGTIGFEIKDGIFKSFCQKASEAKFSEIVDNFDVAWEGLLTVVRNNIAQGSLTTIGSWDFGLSSKDSLKYSSVNTPSQYSFTITKKNIYDAYQGKLARPSGAFQKDMAIVVDYLKDNFALEEFVNRQESSNNGIKNYVFVIDEINRGEISKIFGELFFSIDPSYRGKKGAVKTQYSNLHNDEKELFYVPENIYIIGTMNDIDRSVESFDFAMRRRFTWIEITAEQSADNMSLPVDIKERMLRLNEQISKTEGLNPSYHIGAAYFLDSNGNPRQDIDNIWNLRIEPLLKEYLRGMPDGYEKIELLKNAFIA